VASTVAALTQEHGGASFNPAKGNLAGTAHYAAGVFPDRTKIIKGLPTPEQVGQFMEANKDLLQDPSNSIGTWFNKADGNTVFDISVTTPSLQDAQRLAANKGQFAIFDLGKMAEIPQGVPGAEAMPGDAGPEFHAVGDTAPGPKGFQSPQLQVGEQPLPVPGKNAVAEQKAKLDAFRANAAEERQKGSGAVAMAALTGPAAGQAIPDDPNSQLDDYGRLGLNILGAAGLIGAAVRGRQVKNLSPVQEAASKGAAALWLGGKKAWQQAVGKAASPEMFAASQKLLDRHLATTMNELPKTKKLLALNKAGLAEHQWYDQTEQELKKQFGQDAPLVAKFFAATSNNATVASNASLTLKALKQYKMGEPFTGYLPDVIENLKRAASGQELNGRKIDNFAKALSGDPDAVVVDRWIMRAFGFEKGSAPTDTQYDFMEHAIRQMAEQTGQTPRQVQAAIWFGVKNAAEKGKNRPPSPAPESALQHSINIRHGEALKENRQFDKARAKGLNLPF
jgi:hypothetical protein